MNVNVKTRVLSACAGFLVALSGGKAALADDSEIFVGTSNAGVAPNILFILDTSGSMDTDLKYQVAYDPATTYTGSCSSDRIYFSTSTGLPKGCSGLDYFSKSKLQCSAATGPLAEAGRYTGKFVQWRSRTEDGKTTWRWRDALSEESNWREVDCLGDFTTATAPYPSSGTYSSNTTSNQWTNNAQSSYWGSNGQGASYQIFSGNFLNYRASNPPVVLGSRMDVMKQAATNLLSTIPGNVNVGIMRYSNNSGGSDEDAARGGLVSYPVSPIETNRAGLTEVINKFEPAGWTPLSETLFEAYRYYSGGNVYFGDLWSVKSVKESRVGDTLTSKQYKSPIDFKCQKNFIVYLTDGLPTKDNEADSLIKGLPDFTSLGGACDITTVSPYNDKDADGVAIPEGWDGTSGECMAALARYMYKTDMFAETKMAAQQNVTLYTIGFGDDPALKAASSWLDRAAKEGGGEFHSAGDLDELESALTDIVANISTTSSTFTAPSVAVNAFNRTRTLNDLYVSLFEPSANRHWAGNVKKYRLKNEVIVDKNDKPAVDPTTGFFHKDAQSLWSAEPDGAVVADGGAASRIPEWDPAVPGSRKVYTYLGSNTPGAMVDLSADAAHAVVETNAGLTTAVLGVSTDAELKEAIAYARGKDVKDEDDDSNVTESRRQMGDPLHAQPAVVIYGGTASSTSVNDAVVFTPTNDGFLHAFEVYENGTEEHPGGKELWAFIPKEFLPHLRPVQVDAPTTPKAYALDGNVKVLKYDTNGNGVVEPGLNDRVILFFGTGRGGSRYYALDVTDKNKPLFMWSIGPETPGLSGIGQTWSTPEITRVAIQGASQNSLQYVLVVGGGYDTAEEGNGYQLSNSVGNWLYMIDAVRGTVLWSASNSSSASLNVPRMTHSIPSDVTVLDLDGNGFADRMYVGDMAAQLWRFDVFSGQPPATVVTGGVLASLGSKEETTHTLENTRRFYSAPDVAAVKRRGIEPFLNIAIGSGYRGHPLNTGIEDRFYSIRDYNIQRKLTQAQYNDANRKIIKDSANPGDASEPFLVDVTSNPGTALASGSPGWKIKLNNPGEKVLVPASTFNNVVLFNSYTPNTSAGADPCAPGLGTNRVCAVSVYDGTAASGTQRCQLLAQGGIAPPVSFLFPTAEEGTGTPPPDPDPDPPGGDPTDPPPPGGPGTPGAQQVICMSGVEVLGICRNFNSRLKTYWSESNAK